jgi:1-acyl-sn-glycerol-3-phosphate acyltransferase
MDVVGIRKAVPLPRWFGSCFWGIVSPLAAFLPLLTLQLFQFPSLLLLPVSRRAFAAYNRWFAVIVWGWWSFGLQKLIGVRIISSGDEVPTGENAIIIANHQSMADIPVMLTLAQRKGRIGDLKWLVKDQLKYVPGIGWGLKFLDSVFLKRRWADDQENIERTFRRYIDMQSPMWLLLFPEGTRANAGKLAEHSQALVDAGKDGTRYVLDPRTKGFAASVRGLRSFVTAVYDLTILYPGAHAPSLIQLLRGDIDFVNLHVRRFPMQDLPQCDAELADWLRERFAAKDRTIVQLLGRQGAK